MGDDLNDGSYHGFSMAFARARLFDRFILRGIKTVITPRPTTSKMCSTNQQPFAIQELRRALTEQSFGIKDFRMQATTSSLQATASVTLLEGGSVVVHLSASGYHLDTDAKIYESLDQLLQAVSPLYAQKQHDALLSKLSRLA